MLANLITVAPSVLRHPFMGTLGAVRAIQPLVENALRPHDDDTRYSPGPTQSQIGSVYSSKGSLGGAAAVYQSVSVERDASFDLSIETADGDIATISFTQSQSFSAAGSAQRTGGGLALALQSSRSDNTDMQIAVTGELDAQELASINDLMKQVGGVAEDFFAGDLKQAIKAAAAIGIGGQSDTLSAFSFDLQSQEVRRAVTVYESVATATATATASQAATQPQLPSAAAAAQASSHSFLRDLLALFDTTPQAALF